MLKIFFIFSVLCTTFLSLTACSTEKNYRGVPETAWNQLNGEQKQLIIDKSFHDEVG